MSLAFKPMPKDKSCLSVDHEALVSAQDSLANFLARGFDSVGVQGLSEEECRRLDLPFEADPIPENPAHFLLDFSGLTNNQVTIRAKRLLALAADRGWMAR